MGVGGWAPGVGEAIISRSNSGCCKGDYRNTRGMRPVFSISLTEGEKIMHIMTFLKGAAIGAGFMYLFDPSQGRTRRARIRDKAVHVWNETGDNIEGKSRDLANRAQGLLHDAASALTPSRFSDRGAQFASSS